MTKWDASRALTARPGCGAPTPASGPRCAPAPWGPGRYPRRVGAGVTYPVGAMGETAMNQGARRLHRGLHTAYPAPASSHPSSLRSFSCGYHPRGEGAFCRRRVNPVPSPLAKRTFPEGFPDLPCDLAFGVERLVAVFVDGDRAALGLSEAFGWGTPSLSNRRSSAADGRADPPPVSPDEPQNGQHDGRAQESQPHRGSIPAGGRLQTANGGVRPITRRLALDAPAGH